MAVAPRFASFGPRGGYESFFLRAVDPDRPRAVWLRHTVHRAPGHVPALGAIWITLFDADAPAPVTHKVTLPAPEALPDGVRIGDSRFGPGAVRGGDEAAAWDLEWDGAAAPLRHLPTELLYRTALPRTKLEALAPRAAFRGTVTVGDTTMRLHGWPGTVGHNWGTEHAERWIWLHAVALDGAPGAWLDLALGRVRVGRATTPWIADGALELDGRRLRLGGPAARPRVAETATALDLRLRGGALRLRLTVHAPPSQTVVWRYADPGAREHHVAHCSVAALEAVVAPRDGGAVLLRTRHGAAYERGMAEATHGLPVQPHGDP
ncbi:hypothetical protein FSW04_08675 [Baekduia soli]|uniref:AttH domain-containing protein n=1 Tax=Baekduia soli TaxID=496014 RepID=A0A5B8U3Y0_9ACTN|nr:hypothetical protein [Baekduia soli]QEC47641.1 hypothetical protein FSW04_08675 [Baekduia soli]